MQRRHFLVCEVDNTLKLKEIDPQLARGIWQFGAIEGHYTSVEMAHWTFYFLNTNVTRCRANEIAAQLAHEFSMQ